MVGRADAQQLTGVTGDLGADLLAQRAHGVLLDRAAGEEVPILLTRASTPESVARLSDVFGGSRFNSETKLKRLRELLEEEWTLDQMIQTVGLTPAESASIA